MVYPAPVQTGAGATSVAAAKDTPRATAQAAAQFQSELLLWMTGGQNAAGAGGSGGAAGPVAPAAVLEGLAAAFPGATVTTAGLPSFGAVKEHYAASASSTSVNLDAGTVERMGADAAFARQVTQALSTLLTAGKEQNLVAAGGSSSSTSRHVSVADGIVRYTEVQRTATGSQLSVSSLALAEEGPNGEDIDAVLAELAGAGGGAGNGEIPFSFLFRPAGQDSSLAGQTIAGGNWRMESFLSAGATRTVTTTQERFQQWQIQQGQSQERQITMRETIRQWAETGARVDLQSYMEMVGLTDPLVFDMAGDGVNLRSAEDGVYFDIHGDGRPVRTAFIQGDDAFLYLDQNGNGTADSGAELFGEHGGYANGFAKLAAHDSNHDGVIDVHDAVYDKLRLWRDGNGDGVNQADESLSLADAGIASINLRHGADKRLDRHGNVIADSSSFTRTDGSRGRVADAWLRQVT